jgi:outer membrane protein OmpA-like peptidoglycan-associated protein
MKRLLALVFFVVMAGCTASERGGPAAPVPDAEQMVVFFREGSTVLTPLGQDIVDGAAAKFHAINARGLTVVGEADGATATDVEIAAKRARVVGDALAAKGIDPSRIEVRAGPAPTGESGVEAHKVILRFHSS